MSAYLKFFELEQSPFDGQAQTQVVLGTQALRDALTAIENGLDEGASRICVNGDRGLGKTSLARALPKLLGDQARVAIVHEPSGPWDSIRASVAKQFGLESGGLARARLLDVARERRLVLVIDDAQNASQDFLDHLDVVLSYRTEDDRPVIQSVLLARLKREAGDSPSPLVWWLDRIQTLQLEFAPLPRAGVASYIQRHLKRAGWRGPRLFSEDAAHAIHGYTAGIPGEVSALCERLLGEASARQIESIDAEFVHAVCDADHETPEDPDEEVWSFDGEFEGLTLEDAVGAVGAVGEVDRIGEPDADPSPSADLAAAIESTPPLVSPDPEEHETSSHPSEEDSSELPIGPATDLHGSAGFSIEETQPIPIPPIESGDTATDAASDHPSDEFFEEIFDGPATPEELRALRGGGLSRLARYFVGGVLVVLLAGLAFVYSMGDTESTSPTDLSDSLDRTRPRTDRPTPRTGNPFDASPRASQGSRSQSGGERSPTGGVLPGGGYVPVEVLDRLGKRSPAPNGPEVGVSE